MVDIIFILSIIIVVAALSLTPLFQDSREQKKYEGTGMKVVYNPRGKQMLLPALGIVAFVFVGFFVVLFIHDGVQEDVHALGMMILCIFEAIILLIVCFLAGYCLQRRHILYDGEKILVGRVFDSYKKIYWYEISSMKIKNQDFFRLYNRDGKCCVQADASMVGYKDFYQVALQHTRPEYTALYGNGSYYQKEFTVKNGCGKLCYSKGVYYVIFILSLVITVMVCIMVFLSGGSVYDLPVIIVKEKIYGVLVIPVFLSGSIVAIVYTSLQKITYDRQKLVMDLFPRRKVTLSWQDVLLAECVTDKAGRRTIILHTYGKEYKICEKHFSKGFPELLNMLKNKVANVYI